MLVSTTLCGPGAEASIVDALRSCAHLVEVHLLAVSGAARGALEYALVNHQDVFQKVVFRDYRWPDDYGAARNEMLRWAESFGAEWALTVDTDETLEIAEVPRQAMSEHWLSLAVRDARAGYHKPRWLRCGAGLEWKGRSCEVLTPERDMALVDGQFLEREKTPEQELERMRRGVRNMPAMLEQEEHPQWIRHYAECLWGTGEPEKARLQYQRLAAHPRSNRAIISWAEYRLCELAIQDEDLEGARARAAAALSRDPGFIQEFGWILAYVAARLKEPEDAIMWATYALEAPIDLARPGQRSPTWKQGCEQILASAHMKPSAPKGGGEWTADHFAAREEFADDYRVVASALIQTLFPTHVPPPSHLDLGAGTGLLVRAMCEFGVASYGIEANREAREATPYWVKQFIEFGRGVEDWRVPANLYDIVSCVEVAEHLPESQADTLVDAICSNAREWIYFSAAYPGQGGVGHVNERPREYWRQKFSERGWTLMPGCTGSFIDRLAPLKHCWWLKRNALIFRKL